MWEFHCFNIIMNVNDKLCTSFLVDYRKLLIIMNGMNNFFLYNKTNQMHEFSKFTPA
jgi:hypothetical protein